MNQINTSSKYSSTTHLIITRLYKQQKYQNVTRNLNNSKKLFIKRTKSNSEKLFKHIQHTKEFSYIKTKLSSVTTNSMR